ncbi:MAG: TauD/TfdA dioxygenase family protein [Actinomycetota bacterium]
MTATDVPLIPVPAAPVGHEYRSVTVTKHAGACGAVVGGVDLASDLDDDAIAEVRRALLDNGVIFFRGQSLTPDQQVAFSRRFGPYSPVPFVESVADHPEVIAVVREPQEQQGFVFGGIWHSDFSFLPEPPMGSILHAIEVPPYGSDTIWADQYAAYRTLSPGMRAMVSSLRGVHSAVNAYSPKMQAIHDTFVGMTVHTSEDANKSQEHPAVRVHAESGHKALFVNQQYTVGLAGFYPHESSPLLERLFRHATQESFTCRWHWEAGDVAFWDNRRVQHMVMADVSGNRRYMHRTTVAGEAPLAVGP